LAATTLASRGRVAKTPYFLETISCPALIMGESGNPGRNLGWDGNGKMATIPNEFRESSCRVSRIEIGADNGRFAKRSASRSDRSCVARCSVQYLPLPFSRENFPSGIDYGRFRAGSRLGSQGEERGNLGWFPNELWARFKACYGSKNRADSARFRRQKHR